MHCCILLDFLCELYYDAWIHEDPRTSSEQEVATGSCQVK